MIAILVGIYIVITVPAFTCTVDCSSLVGKAVDD